MEGIQGYDLFIVLAYLLAIPCFGIYFKRYVKTGEDFFLAGRMLPWWVIGFSIIGTNIAATDYVGAAGGAYRFGLVQANFEWIGAIPAIILASLLFVPYYWRAGVYTVPEFLGRRYNEAVRILQTLCWGFFMVFMLGLYYWASGLMLEEYLGIPMFIKVSSIPLPMVSQMAGSWLGNVEMPCGLLLIAAVVGIYTVVGGLAAVAMTDVVQLLVMFVGGAALTVLGLWTLGGFGPLAANLAVDHPDHLRLFLPADHATYPWPAVIFGLAFVASPAWWCCNQAMIQRTLGAKSQWDAKAGMMFAAFPKMLIPIMTTLPGLIALALYPHLDGPDADKAYPWLIKNLLPTGLAGLVFAAFIAALISSVDSHLNSIATLFTKDLYQRHMVKHASDHHYLTVGRLLTAICVIAGIFIAPLTQRDEGIFVSGGTILALFQGPTFAIALLGIYWKRATRWGGLVGMIVGVGISTYLLFRMSTAFFYYCWWSFVGSMIVTVVVSLLTRPEPVAKLRGLVYGLVMQDDEMQDALSKRAGKEDE